MLLKGSKVKCFLNKKILMTIAVIILNYILFCMNIKTFRNVFKLLSTDKE